MSLGAIQNHLHINFKGGLIKIRYSMIDTYLQCPNKFKMQYLDDGPKEEQKSSDLKFGTVMHLALKTHLEGGSANDVFEMYWNSVQSENLEYARYSWEDYKQMALETFLPNFVRLHAKHITEPMMEETLTMPVLGAHELQGTYDCVAMVDGKLTMIDWKTSAREYPHSKIQRNPQLYIYSALYNYKYGKLPEQIMYKVFIKADRRIQTQKLPLTIEKLNATMKNVEQIIEDIVNRKTWYCNYSSCYCGTPNICFPGGK